jgi:NAD(P)-dependent dehydrogenase (short-subunit alcohol dehydrogenase family)
MNTKWLVGMAAGLGAAAATAILFRRDEEDAGALAGQVALITGGSRGLGLALAREFARRGCRIAICARSIEELRKAQADLGDAFIAECDVGDQAAVERMIAAVTERFGRIDILVNNAGEIRVGPAESMTVADYESAMRVMFWGTVYPTLSTLPQMTARKRGRIVNITSIGGKVAVPHLLPYTCAKFAAVGFSEGLHAEMRDSGVKVVTIAPGLMRTGSHLNADFKGDHEKEAAWFGFAASAPGLSIAADRAARQIADATEKGTAEKILTPQANLLARAHGVAPGMTAEILGIVNKLLPAGQNATARRGQTLQSSPLVSALTIFGRLAAERFLQPAARR